MILHPQALLPIAIFQLACRLFMTGVIWHVQIVGYPQLRNLSADAFPRFHPGYTLRTGFVVAPPMLAELGFGVLASASTRCLREVSSRFLRSSLFRTCIDMAVHPLSPDSASWTPSETEG